MKLGVPLVLVLSACNAPLTIGGDAGADLAGPPIDFALSCPADEPATQHVTFRMINTSGAWRYIVAAGSYCTGFSLDGAQPVPLELGAAACGACDCALPAPEYVTQYEPLGPTETSAGPWPARSVRTCMQTVDCPGAPVTVTRGVLQPLAPGTYRVTFGVETMLPANCDATSGACTQPAGAREPALTEFAERCPSTGTASAQFTLPAAGDVTVDVSIP